jgi:hypothetical protein
MEDDATPPAHDHPADAARRLGDAATDATFDPPGGVGRPAVLGLLAGEVGPKAQAGSALRDLSRQASHRSELAPRGSSVRGMGWLLALTLLAMLLVVAAVVALLVWVTS